MARLIGQSLSERLGQSFVIENRPGAGSNIGTEAVVHASPDGYTLLLSTIPNAVNATLYETLNYNFIRDIVPVATLSRVPNISKRGESITAIGACACRFSHTQRQAIFVIATAVTREDGRAAASARA
jgi:hypothetical protein